MQKLRILAALPLLLTLACTHDLKKPEVFLEEPQMIDVMTDAYLIEAQLNQMKSDGQDVSELQLRYYDLLFEHYGLTDSLFEANLNYYTHHPDILERVMDSVTNRLVKAQ